MNQSSCKQTLFGEIVNENLKNRIEINIKFNELKDNFFLNLLKKYFLRGFKNYIFQT